ncbi:PREDICTED: uncharacterized protein LOC105457747 [Wasmannia auropunctata]|uniref:uncharacterized protein LOC105457747 n=1 Tax=Wasmannia auropunctata TaxID=64793 RepID=UPI0005EDEE4F|nr:PREDICTED: uncharacterized protein LOC105457747 [Wasmannia auropunctata]
MQPERERLNSIVLNGITSRRLWELLGTACVFLVAPLIMIAIIILYIYRRLVEFALRIQLRDKFAGLLEGMDCIWAIEDAVSPCIINTLMILEKAPQDSNANFLESLRILMNERIVSKAAGTTFEKMFYLRSQKFGYYFWERSETVNLKDRIRWLECVNANCDGSCENICSESFRKTLESVCTKPLPNDGRAAWEILVGRRCPRSRSHEKDYLCPDESFNTDTRKIPVLIRIHHSLGDGVALLGLWFKAIVEEDETKETRVKIKNIASSSKTQERLKPLKQQVKMLTKHTWLSHKVIVTQLYRRIKEVTRITMALFSYPKYVVQLAVRSTDKNIKLNS